jgi:hypothetical protein
VRRPLSNVYVQYTLTIADARLLRPAEWPSRTTNDRHVEKLREELTLVRIERHWGQLEELDVEGILAFAERVLPRAADLWVQASLEQRQRFQQLFFPEGIAFDGKRFVRTGVTAPAFSYLRPIESGNEGLVAQIFTRWNRIVDWLGQIASKPHKQSSQQLTVLWSFSQTASEKGNCPPLGVNLSER